jgi:hypothetical protein
VNTKKHEELDDEDLEKLSSSNIVEEYVFDNRHALMF